MQWINRPTKRYADLWIYPWSVMAWAMSSVMGILMATQLEFSSEEIGMFLTYLVIAATVALMALQARKIYRDMRKPRATR